MDIVCFCHLRWDFVYQRPQHLLSRAANDFRVILIEEPIDGDADAFEHSLTKEGVYRVVPKLSSSQEDREKRLMVLTTRIIHFFKVKRYATWYYSPLFYSYTAHLEPEMIIYDCMDELSAFKFASPLLKKAEADLMAAADVVLTGGRSLYVAKKDLHPNVYCFPSSIDHNHFKKGRDPLPDPADQALIAAPRLGFFGVVDERFDIELLKTAAESMPASQFVIIGPVVKIDPAELPKADNIHYLGSKSYDELPAYIANWDLALVLFARNEATRYISPTKTPEYLCAGKPVISTPIADVIYDFGKNPLVRIVEDAGRLKAAAEELLDAQNRQEMLADSDRQLASNSWDITYAKIRRIIEEIHTSLTQQKKEPVYV